MEFVAIQKPSFCPFRFYLFSGQLNPGGIHIHICFADPETYIIPPK